MSYRLRFIFCLVFIGLTATGCASSPNYINDANNTNSADNSDFNTVHFKLDESFINTPPKCVAILPFKANTKNPQLSNSSTGNIEELTDAKLVELRWNLYSHLAPYPYRDVELEKVNNAISSLGNKAENYALLGSTLQCDALLVAEVTDYGTTHLGFYSQSSVGVQMKLIRSENGKVIWEGNHVAKSHAGGFPITPIDIAVSIFSATDNISDEQLVRVGDDLFRRLLSTWDAEFIDEPQTQHVQLAEAKNDSYPFYVSVQQLFLRSGPGTEYAPKDVLEKNEKLAMLDEQHSPWVQVKLTSGKLGYVNKKYITSRALESANQEIVISNNSW